MSYIDDITIDEFKTYFARMFPFAPETDPTNQEYITDADIQIAFGQAKVNFPIALFDEENGKIAFLFLVAHYLCMDMQMAQSGINSTAQYMVTSKSVGDVSASYGVPQKLLNNLDLLHSHNNINRLYYFALLHCQPLLLLNTIL